MTPLRYITAIIGGGALGYFITVQFDTGGYYLAILGIAILALYLNLLLSITTTKVIVQPREIIREQIPEAPKEPKVLYKRKSGVIEEATIEISKYDERPYINLTIKTPPFSIGGKIIEKVFKPIGLMTTSGPLQVTSLDNLRETTGIEPEGLDKDTFEPGQTISNLIDIPIYFELLEQEYAGTMRLKVGKLFKTPVGQLFKTPKEE